MTKRLQKCLLCEPDTSDAKFKVRRGFTRHADRVCSRCRRFGAPAPKGWPWGRAA